MNKSWVNVLNMAFLHILPNLLNLIYSILFPRYIGFFLSKVKCTTVKCKNIKLVSFL